MWKLVVLQRLSKVIGNVEGSRAPEHSQKFLFLEVSDPELSDIPVSDSGLVRGVARDGEGGFVVAQLWNRWHFFIFLESPNQSCLRHELPAPD